ncbi:hypothetical protein, partial [Klebsiella sp. D-Nf1]|uniref:hypothetical protein n=1 Tax=Klebsiella sp. D-Nf1 TaxID=2054604 RepID=UPI000CCA0BFE
RSENAAKTYCHPGYAIPAGLHGVGVPGEDGLYHTEGKPLWRYRVPPKTDRSENAAKTYCHPGYAIPAGLHGVGVPGEDGLYHTEGKPLWRY